MDEKQTQQETLSTIDELAESYRRACRKPADLEDWALRHVPGLLERVRRAESSEIFIREIDDILDVSESTEGGAA